MSNRLSPYATTPEPKRNHAGTTPERSGSRPPSPPLGGGGGTAGRRNCQQNLPADLATASRGNPVEWVIERDGHALAAVTCPDAHTAQILATFRFGMGVTVRRAESPS
jgi:hypothetical protein